MSLRPSTLPRHGRRALVASGLAAALVAVPGIAFAEETAPADARSRTRPWSSRTRPRWSAARPGRSPVRRHPRSRHGTERVGGARGWRGGVPRRLRRSRCLTELEALFAQAGFSAECIERRDRRARAVAGPGWPPCSSSRSTPAGARGLPDGTERGGPGRGPAHHRGLLTGFVPAEGRGGSVRGHHRRPRADPRVARVVRAHPARRGGARGARARRPRSAVARPRRRRPLPQVQQPVAQPVAYPGYAPTGADTARPTTSPCR